MEEEKMVAMSWIMDGLRYCLPFDMWPARRFSHRRSGPVCLLAVVYVSDPMQDCFLLCNH